MLDASLIFDGTFYPTTGIAITATRVSTNVLDLLAGRDIGAGIAYDQELHVDCLQTFTAAGAATLQVSFQGSLDNVTFYDMVFSPVLAKAGLIAGVPIFRYPVPVNQLNMPGAPDFPPRYVRLNYTVATGPFTAGTVVAYLNVDREERITYPKNYTAA